jgi:hypothetical protein
MLNVFQLKQFLKWTCFPGWTFVVHERISMMNKFQLWRFPCTNIFEEQKGFPPRNISIIWTNFNYEQIPTSSNFFENERIPTLNIFKKLTDFYVE